MCPRRQGDVLFVPLDRWARIANVPQRLRRVRLLA